MIQDRPELRLSITQFMEVQHRVFIDGKLGPLHKHSCSVEVEIVPPYDNTVPFAELESHVRDQVSPFDGRTLNDVSAFQGINPSIENLAQHLYHSLQEILGDLGCTLLSLIVKESPTRSVKIVRRIVHDYALFDGSKTTLTTREPYGDLPPSPNQRPASDYDPDTVVEADYKWQGRENLFDSPVEGGVLWYEQEERVPAADFWDSNNFDESGRIGMEVILQPLEPFIRKLPEIPERIRAIARAMPKISPVPFALLLLCAVIYSRLLWPPTYSHYPWGSDTWGHVAKAEFLLKEIRHGNFFPLFYPGWYNGVEPFRYWAPLPYYVLVLIMQFTADGFRAAGAYVAVCAFVGGAGWLLQRNRIGCIPSILCAALWMIWPDHVRVAMSEGNLPRALATAIFPWVLHHYLLVLERKHWPGAAVTLVLLSGLLVLAHAMIAAGFFVAMTLMAFMWTIVGGLRVRDVTRGILLTFTGIALVAWWLLPALRGGIMQVNKEAVTVSIDYFPLTVSFNPTLRLTNPEVFYWGLAIAPVCLWLLVTWGQRSGLARASLLVGLALVGATTVTLSPIYNALPLHHLLWPLYLASAAPAMFFLAVFMPATRGFSRRRKFALMAIVVFATVFAIDAVPTLRLISTRPLPTGVERIARQLPRVSEGWRVATMDLSRFGSVAPHRFGADNTREQVFGWAWQGAATSQNIVWLNRAVMEQHWPFLFDRLYELGATSIVFRRQLIDQYIDEVLAEASRQGFTEKWRSNEAILLTGEAKSPYALGTHYRALGIGRFSDNLAMMFPALEVGSNTYIDSYKINDLRRYETVVVTGAAWYDKRKAETLLLEYVKRGGRLVIDLQGLPEDVLSRRPSMFGVSGEPLNIYGQMEGRTAFGEQRKFQPFDPVHHPWKAISPQGLTRTHMYILHFDEKAAIVGTREVDGEDVWFIGGNLPYHAFITRDPVAIGVLAEVLGLEPYALPVRQAFPLTGYSADARGYRFFINTAGAGENLRVIIPVAFRTNMQVEANGISIAFSSTNNLVTLDAEPGQYYMCITTTVPIEFRNGAVLSCVVALLFWKVVLNGKRGAKHEVQDPKRSAADNIV